jgi:hypothetical protein
MARWNPRPEPRGLATTSGLIDVVAAMVSESIPQRRRTGGAAARAGGATVCRGHTLLVSAESRALGRQPRMHRGAGHIPRRGAHRFLAGERLALPWLGARATALLCWGAGLSHHGPEPVPPCSTAPCHGCLAAVRGFDRERERWGGREWMCGRLDRDQHVNRTAEKF